MKPVLGSLWLFSVLCAADAACADTILRVMTYNIHHAEGMDKEINIDRIAAVIQAAKPDIVCLQEVDRNLPRTAHADMPALFAKKLDMTVVFEPNYQFDGGEYGNATLSRFPIVSHENMRLPGPPGAEPRGCLRILARMGDRTVEVLNTHFGLDAEERKNQAGALTTQLHDAPTVLCGDLNETPNAPAVAILVGRMRDASAVTEKGKTSTFPSHSPKRRIDHILVSGPWDVLSCAVISTSLAEVASDHRPCLAELRLGTPPDKTAVKGVYDNDDERVIDAIAEGN